MPYTYLPNDTVFEVTECQYLDALRVPCGLRCGQFISKGEEFAYCRWDREDKDAWIKAHPECARISFYNQEFPLRTPLPELKDEVAEVKAAFNIRTTTETWHVIEDASGNELRRYRSISDARGYRDAIDDMTKGNT